MRDTKDQAEERGAEIRKAQERLHHKNREADTAAEKVGHIISAANIGFVSDSLRSSRSLSQLRQFNKKFYREFKQNARGGSSNGTAPGTSSSSGNNDPKYKQATGMGGDKAAPSKPKNLR